MMNQRIQELAEQAEQHANEQNDKHGIRFKSEYDRKFAELIIRECASVADQYVNDGDWDIPELIRRNFGVEK